MGYCRRHPDSHGNHPVDLRYSIDSASEGFLILMNADESESECESVSVVACRAPAQLTIFYNGSVCVSADKVDYNLYIYKYECELS